MTATTVSDTLVKGPPSCHGSNNLHQVFFSFNFKNYPLYVPEKKNGNKIAKYQQLFSQRPGYISDFALIYPEKNLADF